MAKPTNSLTGKNGRRYYFPLPTSENPKPDNLLPAVTTVIGIKAKPGLYNWYANQAARCAQEKWRAAAAYIRTSVENGTSIKDALEAAELNGIAPEREHIAGAGNRALKNAGRVGVAIHNYIYKVYAEKQDPDKVMQDMISRDGNSAWVDLERDPWIKPVHEFFTEHVAEVLYGERSVYSETHNYAGTPDMIARMKPSNEIAVIDWKSGRGVYVDVAIQLNAYSLAEWVEPDPTELDEDGEALYWDNPPEPMPKIDYGLCMHLKGDYTMDAYRVGIGDRFQNFFLNLLHAYNANLEAGRKDTMWYENILQLTAER